MSQLKHCLPSSVNNIVRPIPPPPPPRAPDPLIMTAAATAQGDPVPEKSVSREKAAQSSRVSQIRKGFRRTVPVDLPFFCCRASEIRPSSRKVSPGRLAANGNTTVPSRGRNGTLISVLEDMPLDDSGGIVSREDIESPWDNSTILAGSTVSDVDSGALQDSLVTVSAVEGHESGVSRSFSRPRRSFGVVVDAYVAPSGDSAV